MSGYEKEMSLFYHLIVWIGWIKVFPLMKKDREIVHEDDGATNRRVSRRTSNATQERDVDSCCKGKAPRKISSSFSSDDGDNEGSKWGGGTSGDNRGVGGTGEGIGGDGSTGGGYVSQVDPCMSWVIRAQLVSQLICVQLVLLD